MISFINFNTFFSSLELSYIQRLQFFFQWARNEMIDGEVISVELLGKKIYYYLNSNSHFGRKFRLSLKMPNGGKVIFTVFASKSYDINNKWLCIFKTPGFEVWENKERSITIPPLRWGLSEETKEIAFTVARDVLKHFLLHKTPLSHDYFEILPSQFYLKVNVGVALWVNGSLRGSKIVQQKLLGEGIAEAATLAARDNRFKPLEYHELPETRIEITLFSDLKVPLSAKDYAKGDIYPEKGYVLEYKKHRGWFFPEVFNCTSFRNLEDFLACLTYKKAHLRSSNQKSAHTFIFEVIDFIESTIQTPLDLDGPVIRGPVHIELKKNAITEIKKRICAAADWLCAIQEVDGRIPPIIYPWGERPNESSRIDWSRLAFTAWSLAEAGKVVEEERYIKSAKNSFHYIQRYIFKNKELRLSLRTHTFSLAYFGQLACFLEELDDATKAMKIILSNVHDLPFDPMLFSQMTSFLNKMSRNEKYNHGTQNELKELLTISKESFEEMINHKQMPTSLAKWAELVNTFFEEDRLFSMNVAAWLAKHQLSSGAFPNTTHSSFVYTRGTSKIFEVLSLYPDIYKREIAKTLEWLFKMQYDGENTFFISKERRPYLIGGFRHDYFNQTAWIDSAGHFLLGAARFLEGSKEG